MLNHMVNRTAVGHLTTKVDYYYWDYRTNAIVWQNPMDCSYGPSANVQSLNQAIACLQQQPIYPSEPRRLAADRRVSYQRLQQQESHQVSQFQGIEDYTTSNNQPPPHGLAQPIDYRHARADSSPTGSIAKGQRPFADGQQTHASLSQFTQIDVVSETNTKKPDVLLRDDFRKPKQPRKFFKVGKVFSTLYSEASDNSSVVSGSRAWTKTSYGEYVHSKVRRFVVVKEGDFACSALPITTYGGQGVAKDGVKKSDHCIIFTGKRSPEPTVHELPRIHETGMQPFPIRVDVDSLDEKLDIVSRLDFARPTPIQHYVKARSFGMVNRDSLRHLTTQFKSVMSEESSRLARTASNSISYPLNTLGPAPITDYERALEMWRNGWSYNEAVQVLMSGQSRSVQHFDLQRRQVERKTPPRTDDGSHITLEAGTAGLCVEATLSLEHTAHET